MQVGFVFDVGGVDFVHLLFDLLLHPVQVRQHIDVVLRNVVEAEFRVALLVEGFEDFCIVVGPRLAVTNAVNELDVFVAAVDLGGDCVELFDEIKGGGVVGGVLVVPVAAEHV